MIVSSLDRSTPELGRRCQCDRPNLLEDDDGSRCIKCGRSPAIRLGPGSLLTPADLGLLFLRELGRG